MQGPEDSQHAVGCPWPVWQVAHPALMSGREKAPSSLSGFFFLLFFLSLLPSTTCLLPHPLSLGKNHKDQIRP